uniref:Si:dkeyp-51f12.3 n=1 Tax=Poecilia formosa TaxID=48698 RepID=A0A087YDJ3_POEFO
MSWVSGWPLSSISSWNYSSLTAAITLRAANSLPKQRPSDNVQRAPEMSIHHSTLLCLGVLLMTSGGIVIFSSGTLYHASLPLMVLGIFLGMGGLSVVVAGVCMAKKNLQVGVPGHFLLHPPTGTRFSPQQALAIQRRLDRIRREMSTDAASTSPEPEPSLPSTPPPWTMEPPPSYDTVMKSQHINQE